MKKDSSTETLSIYSSTGNLLATESSSIHRYDPFGGQINQTGSDEGFGASATREYEKHFSIEVIQMGARIYVPTLGRFLQVDPVEGGTQNDYVYPSDPVNTNDFSGEVALAVILWGLWETINAVFSVAAFVLTAAVPVAAADCAVQTNNKKENSPPPPSCDFVLGGLTGYQGSIATGVQYTPASKDSSKPVELVNRPALKEGLMSKAGQLIDDTMYLNRSSIFKSPEFLLNSGFKFNTYNYFNKESGISVGYEPQTSVHGTHYDWQTRQSTLRLRIYPDGRVEVK